MTFASKIAAGHTRFGYFVHIEGVSVVLKTHEGIDASTILGDTYTEIVALSEDLFSQGTETLDYVDRIVKGGGLNLTVVDDTRTLRGLVQPRKRRVAYLTADTTLSGSLTLNSTAALTAGDVIYIGSESIVVGTVASATSLTGCSRGQYESRAVVHVAGALDGEAVYTRPPAWKGRKVTLYAVVLDYRAQGGSGDAEAVGFFSLSGAPRIVSPDVWQIECDPWIERFLEARIGSGLTDVEATSSFSGILGDSVELSVVDPSQFVVGAKKTYVKFSGQSGEDSPLGGEAIAELTGVTAPFIELAVSPSITLDPLVLTEVKTARHIAIVGGGFALLELLCSETGAGTEYDVLPGSLRASRDGRTWRFGAAIPSTELDTLTLSSDRRQWWYPVVKEVEVAEVLRDWCVAQDMVAVVDSVGKLSARRLSSDENAATFDFFDSLIADDASVKIEADEGQVFTSVRFKANFSPISEEYLFDDVIKDFDLESRFPHRTDELVIESRGLGIDVDTGASDLALLAGRPRGASRGEIEGLLRQVQVRGGRTPIRVAFSYGLKAYAVRVGDVVGIDFPSWPDLEGGTLTGRTARVVERRARWKDGVFDFVVEVLDKLFKIAPSAVIAGFSTTVAVRDTITLSNSTLGSSADADQDFDAIGLQIVCWDASAGTSTQHTVLARVSATQLRVSPGLPATVTTGEDWITWEAADNNGTLSPTNGDTEDDWLIQQPADGTPAAAGQDRRWR